VRSLEPENRLVKTRLQQMHLPDPEIIQPDLRVARTEANSPLLGRDGLLHRPGHEPAITECRNRVHPVAIERERSLVFGNGLFEPLLRAQHLGFGIVSKGRARRCRQGLIGEGFGTCEVGSGRVGHLIEDAGGQLPR